MKVLAVGASNVLSRAILVIAAQCGDTDQGDLTLALASGLRPFAVTLGGEERLPIWDNLAGHLSCSIVQWLFQQGVMPLDTPISGSWLNMAESVQRILVTRALAGQHPRSSDELIQWLEDTVAGWNQAPTPFVWHGRRRERRVRARRRRLGGSGAGLADHHSIAA